MGYKIIVLAYGLLQADKKGGDRRLCTLLEILARQHQVDFWGAEDSLPAPEKERSQNYLHQLGVVNIYLGWEELTRALAKIHYDVSVFECYYMAEELTREIRRRQPGTKIIIDSEHVHFARELSEVKLGLKDAAEALETRDRELAAYRAADAVVVVSPEDEEILSALDDIPPLFVVPMAIPVRPRLLLPRPPDILFIGGFNYPANIDALSWFVEEIWPRVKLAVPDVRLRVVGSNAPPKVLLFGEVPGIEIVGYVLDMHSYLDQAEVFIAPLTHGGGIKIKVIEAMASGVPVVTTSLGAHGLKVVPGEHLMVADSSADFANALIDLLPDNARCESLGLAGQERVAILCEPEAIRKVLDRMLNQLALGRHSFVDLLRWRSFHAMKGLQILTRSVSRSA